MSNEELRVYPFPSLVAMYYLLVVIRTLFFGQSTCKNQDLRETLSTEEDMCIQYISPKKIK